MSDVHDWCHRAVDLLHCVATSRSWSIHLWVRGWCPQCRRPDGRYRRAFLSLRELHLTDCYEPQYQAEAAPSQLRGTLTATYQLFITMGILVACAPSFFSVPYLRCSFEFRLHIHWDTASSRRYFLEARHWDRSYLPRHAHPWYFCHARITTVSTYIPLWTTTADISACSWLCAHGQSKRAAIAIARIYGIPVKEAEGNRYVQAEVDEIVNQIEAEKRFKAGWLDCFKPRNKTLYRTLLGMSLQSLQQLTGANYFFYYGATVFQSVGIQDSFVTQIILGAVNFICTFGGLYVMERVSVEVRLLATASSYLLRRHSLDVVAHSSSEDFGNRCGSSCLLPREPLRTRRTTRTLGSVRDRVFSYVLPIYRICSHDCRGMYVHSGLRDDLGSWNLDSHWRDVPNANTRKTRGLVDIIQLVSQPSSSIFL